MIPARRWRRAAVGAVVAADVLLLLVGGSALPGLVLFAGPLLALFTVLAVRRPGGWSAFVLVLLQVVSLGLFRGVPESVTDWALAALCGALVLVTHLSLALLAAWAPGAPLPRPTLLRWAGQAGVLALAGGVAAGIGILGSATPTGAWQWVAAAALLLVVATTALLRGVARGR